MFIKQVYISVSLCLIIGLFTLKSALVMGYYICFTENFIENYCVNKNQPELNCDGKCYLSQLLDRNSNEQQGQKEMMLLTSAELVFYIDKIQISQDFKGIVDKAQIIWIKHQNYAFNFHKTLIKPPESLA